MTEHPTSERRSAHERLSTGALARWGRTCATHPWRVIGAWVGILVVLIGLVATVGGSLRDEFEIPGSDAQKATDLIESEFASEQGGVLNVVFAAPEGERLDTPERRAAVEEAVARLRSPEFAPTADRAGLDERRRPLQPETRSPTTAASPTPRRSSTSRSRTRTATRSSRCEDAVREAVAAGRRDRRVQRRGGVPADRAGDPGDPRPARGDHRAADRVPHVHGDAHPDRAWRSARS